MFGFEFVMFGYCVFGNFDNCGVGFFEFFGFFGKVNCFFGVVGCVVLRIKV